MTAPTLARRAPARAALACGLGLALACPGPGCAGGAAEPARSVLLVSVDTLRADHLGCYGYERPTSPHIDALAERGTLFESMRGTAPWTLPSHASMLTGLYPAYHGLQEDHTMLAPETPLLAERFAAAGYFTVAVVSHVYVSKRFGFDRGFDVFDDSLVLGRHETPDAESVVDRFLERLDAGGGTPFFGFLHLYDPHWDYAAPEPFHSRFADPGYEGEMDGTFARFRSLVGPDSVLPPADVAQLAAYYDGEIAYVDSQLGRLFGELEERGLFEDTVVVVTGDHGEEFQDHGGLGHGHTLYEEQLRVPLIVAHHPAFPPGTRRKDPASQVDLFPTLLELVGLPSGFVQGRSLVDPSSTRPLPVLAESIQFGNRMRAAVRGPFKAVETSGRRTFFDLSRDRGERRPLEADPTGGELAAELDAYSSAADAGWHLELVARRKKPLRCRGVLRTAGRIADARCNLSEVLGFGGRSGRGADVHAFELDDEGRALRVDVELWRWRGELFVELDPPDAELLVDLEVGGPAKADLFLGDGSGGPEEGALVLRPGDARLERRPGTAVPSGCYVSFVPGRTGPTADLTAEERARLEALGYAQVGE